MGDELDPSNSDPGGIPSWRPPRTDVVAATVGGKRRPWLLWLAAGLGGLLVFGFAAAVFSAVRERAKVGTAVRSYVNARAGGDANTACDQMTQGEWRDLVSHASGTPVASATHSDCARWVLTNSTASPYLSPDLAVFRQNGFKFRVEWGPAHETAVVYPKGLDRPLVELIKDRGDWKIDELAAEQMSFVDECADIGRTKGECGCLFGELRSRNYDSWIKLEQVLAIMKTKTSSPDLVAAEQACSATGAAPGDSV